MDENPQDWLKPVVSEDTHMMLRTSFLGLCMALSSTAFACNITAWSATVGNPKADDPDTSAQTNPAGGVDGGAVKRYAGQCGMQPAAGVASYVVDNSPDGEQDWQVRFYVYTGTPSGNATLFQAYPTDGATGAPIFGVRYRPGAAFDAMVGGTANASVSGIQANRWYRVEVRYQAGQPLRMTVQGAGANEQVVTGSSSGVPTGAVQSAALGSITPVGNSNTLHFDAYASKREAGAVGRLCRGDANNDGVINIFDTVVISNERVRGMLASGQPDCNEDGAINIFDNACATMLRLGSATCN